MSKIYYPQSIVMRKSPAKSLLLLFLLALVGLILVTFISSQLLLENMNTRGVRVVSILQDLLVFILPAVLMAVLVSNRPAQLLEIDRRPDCLWSLMAILALLTATPFMNLIVEWNENVKLPDSMHHIEVYFRDAEDSAQEIINVLMGGTGVMDLVMGLLIIGVMAGVSEELFFRGAILGCLLQTKMGKHVAIWTTAVIFSLFHCQFFGFVPRILLGAYFGYLTVWTGSIWVPAVVHVFNNSVIVVASWMMRSGITDHDYSQGGHGGIMLVVGSIILTAGILRASLKHLPKIKKPTGNVE